METSVAAPAGESRPQVQRLRRRVERIGPLEVVTARLPVSGVEYQITRPVDVDALLDAAEDDPEQNLPYWAALWPSGVALADAILAQPELVRHRRVLELGCGLGTTAIAALASGALLLATDYANDSLALCRYNAARNAGREPDTRQLNWRKPGREFLRLARGGFPVVLAADVLYEERDIDPLLDLTWRIVAPGGLLWLAEPRRSVAARFVESARERGWSGETVTFDGPWPELDDTGVRVRIHQLRRPRA
jgi:predicted nicotinamide N-methyase